MLVSWLHNFHYFKLSVFSLTFPPLSRLFGAKCDKCLRSFGKNDYVMRAKNKIFHLECFQCAACEKQLMPGNEYSLRQDELFCKDHSLEGSGVGGVGGAASIVSPGINGDLKKENALENNNTILQHHNTSNSSEDNSEGRAWDGKSNIIEIPVITPVSNRLGYQKTNATVGESLNQILIFAKFTQPHGSLYKPGYQFTNVGWPRV